MTSLIDGFLLSRQWRDTKNGIELSFWLATDQDPVRLVIENERAVCFVRRDNLLKIPHTAHRKALALKDFDHADMDGLYFRQQRDLQAIRDHLAYDKSQLYESEVKPTERYLMERFITAPMTVQGQVIQRDSFREIRQPKLKPAKYTPSLRWISLDIETHDLRGQLYSIAVSTVDSHQIFMVKHPDQAPAKASELNITWCDDEQSAVEQSLSWIRNYDPDVIIGWNVIGFDLSFLKWKCQELKIPFALGRGGETATVLESQMAGQIAVARVPGRIVLDGIAALKSAFMFFDHYALGFVAQHILGQDKLIEEGNKLEEIRRQYLEDPVGLAAYNLQDCELVARIFEEKDLINFSLERARMTGLAIDRQGGSTAAFDNLYLPRLHRQGFVAPDIGSQSNVTSSPGGYVMDSTPGLYKNVLVLDFKSLYPSIIRTFKIDPMGLSVGLVSDETNTIPGFLNAQFSREQHILPELVTQLWQDRDAAKKVKNAPLSYAIKIIMNSFYGVLGSSGCRFFNPQLASSITRRGHEIIQQSATFIEQEGYSVIYGDTDSVFVHLHDDLDEPQSEAIGDELARKLNIFWQEQLQQRFKIESCLEIEFETHYLRFLMPTIRGSEAGSKKRYAGAIRQNGDTEMVFKGLETVRSDWTMLAKVFQQELYRRIFNDLPYADYVREISEQLYAGKFDDQLTYTKRLRRPLESYVSSQPPQVKAARKMKNPGRRIQYVMTLNGPEPLENLTAIPDYQHYQDKQLQPVADSILYFLDTSFERLTQRQMDVFGQ
ncbi:DNA polymerase II [Leucothrix arctica]|uniref:DNA polymerase n=1 Tax=Leucothrix arctica TaxID=1481894 RepID=A0A317CEQ7_9GAMM|nr:DNA polymerase II [Leucothrix arctica]PWQ94612.1 DNA polymerase II [Leucothrix arctica]